MSLTVKIIYAKDNSSTKIGSVPLSCTILKIKNILKQINKMNSINTIRVVYRGKILPDDLSIGSLTSDGQEEITFYVSGITTLQSTNQSQNTIKPPNTESNKDFKKNRVQNNHLKRNVFCSNYFYLCICLLILFLISLILIKSVYFNPTDYGLPDDGYKLHCSKQAVLYGVIFFDLMITLILFIIISKLDFTTFFRYVYLFFVSLIPNWDINEYRQNHGLDHL